MADAIGDWEEGLAGFVAARRQEGGPHRHEDPAVVAAERSILGASLATRLADLDDIRRAWRAFTGISADPVVVVTTSTAGLAAVDSLLAMAPEIAAVAGDRVVAVTEPDYRLWCIRHPDDGHRLHVNLWSWIKTRVPPQRWPEFAAHPLGDGESYWLHREGLAGAGPLDRRACHLWKFNGRHAALLRAFVTERGVGPLGTAGDEA